MELTFVHDRAPYAHRLEELSDISWTEVLGLVGSTKQLGEQCDGVVIDLRRPIPPEVSALLRESSARPVLILTSADAAVDAVRVAGQLDVDVGLAADWRVAVASFCTRVRESLAYRIQIFVATHGLTAQEGVVLSLLAADLDRYEIAERLDRSSWTVNNHIKSILTKSGLARAACLRRVFRGATLSARRASASLIAPGATLHPR